MWQLLRDTLETARLRARYQRLVHQQLVELTESSRPEPISDDSSGWHLIGGDKSGLSESQRLDARSQARQLASTNPLASNILRLLEIYVAGPGLTLSHRSRNKTALNESPVPMANRLWQDFLSANCTHWNYREHARRTWRDGEVFARKFVSRNWPAAVRFIDPECIGSTTDHPHCQGIVTDDADVETPIAYLRLDPDTMRLAEWIDASEVHHAAYGIDSNQKRGVTVFAPLLETLNRYGQWIETELTARKLQSSIVLWRKVQGGPSHAASAADGAATSYGHDAMRRERIRPGTILTTSHGTDIEFLQPKTNFGDAVPLGRMLLLNLAAGAGLPEFMLTADASNANFASTMIAEGPAVKLFQSEQDRLAKDLTRFWRWIMDDAVRAGLLPADFFESVEPHWSFPPLVNRDRPRERLADVRLVEGRILSRAEVARRDGVDPEQMRAELNQENAPGLP